MSPLAEAVYEILRCRVGLADPRITYGDLARQLQETDAFEYVTHRSRELYAALWEVGGECQRLQLPALPALVVRADTGRPGDAYFADTAFANRAEGIAAWQHDLDAVGRTTYPQRN